MGCFPQTSITRVRQCGNILREVNFHHRRANVTVPLMLLTGCSDSKYFQGQIIGRPCIWRHLVGSPKTNVESSNSDGKDVPCVRGLFIRHWLVWFAHMGLMNSHCQAATVDPQGEKLGVFCCRRPSLALQKSYLVNKMYFTTLVAPWLSWCP